MKRNDPLYDLSLRSKRIILSSGPYFAAFEGVTTLTLAWTRSGDTRTEGIHQLPLLPFPCNNSTFLLHLLHIYSTNLPTLCTSTEAIKLSNRTINTRRAWTNDKNHNEDIVNLKALKIDYRVTKSFHKACLLHWQKLKKFIPTNSFCWLL